MPTAFEEVALYLDVPLDVEVELDRRILTVRQILELDRGSVIRMNRSAGENLDVRIGGGPATIREFLAVGLIDYAHIVVVPIVLGRGERLWDGLEGLEERFQIEAVNSPSGVTHVALSRR